MPKKAYLASYYSSNELKHSLPEKSRCCRIASVALTLESLAIGGL